MLGKFLLLFLLVFPYINVTLNMLRIIFTVRTPAFAKFIFLISLECATKIRLKGTYTKEHFFFLKLTL